MNRLSAVRPAESTAEQKEVFEAVTGGTERATACSKACSTSAAGWHMLFDRWELALDDTLEHVRAEGWL